MTGAKLRVLIFYSSKVEPELLTLYAEGLAYLKNQDIDLEVIDVAENKEKAEELNVNSTPTVLIESDGEIVKRYEAISYMHGTLEKEELKKLLDHPENP